MEVENPKGSESAPGPRPATRFARPPVGSARSGGRGTRSGAKQPKAQQRGFGSAGKGEVRARRSPSKGRGTRFGMVEKPEGAGTNSPAELSPLKGAPQVFGFRLRSGRKFEAPRGRRAAVAKGGQGSDGRFANPERSAGEYGVWAKAALQRLLSEEGSPAKKTLRRAQRGKEGEPGKGASARAPESPFAFDFRTPISRPRRQTEAPPLKRGFPFGSGNSAETVPERSRKAPIRGPKGAFALAKLGRTDWGLFGRGFPEAFAVSALTDFPKALRTKAEFPFPDSVRQKVFNQNVVSAFESENPFQFEPRAKAVGISFGGQNGGFGGGALLPGRCAGDSRAKRGKGSLERGFQRKAVEAQRPLCRLREPGNQDSRAPRPRLSTPGRAPKGRAKARPEALPRGGPCPRRRL